MADKKFVDGLFVKEPHPNAPDFVKMKISIKRKDLGNWLRKQTEDQIEIDVNVSQGGKWYCAVNDFVPDPSRAQQSQGSSSNQGQSFDAPPPEDDDIPF